mmetsp:Transcript_4873/g.4629  ORF Transcript_4873/g.4629 Transcript_4873/m.4629 type:complete len:146 (+) Transcript_4873:457-894(+)
MKLIKKDRLPGLYRSMLPTLGRDIPGYGMFFASYGYFMRLFGVDQISIEEDKAKFYLYSILAGGFAGQLSWIIGYPYDSVKSFMHYHPRHRKVIPTFIYIVKKFGYRRLYNGITPCLLRAFPINSIIFAVYEFINNKFRKMEDRQ